MRQNQPTNPKMDGEQSRTIQNLFQSERRGASEAGARAEREAREFGQNLLNFCNTGIKAIQNLFQPERRERGASEAGERTRREASARAERELRELLEHDKAEEKRAEEAREKKEKANRDAAEAREQAEKHRANAEKAKREADEACKQGDEALKRAEQDRLQSEEQKKLLESQLDQATADLRKGIQPVIWPTEQEIQDAKARVQYRADRINFAVCGFTGTGKSSLVNAIRGVKNSDVEAAPTGVVETTMDIARYPDIRKEDPFPRFVWFDVPGGGGAEITDWQYFNQQGLFIFDMIIIVYDTRVTKVDISILQNCHRFKIPALIVRSKADNHIRQTMKDLGYSKIRKAEKDEIHAKARSKFISETRLNVEESLREAGIQDQDVYIISSETLYETVTGGRELKTIDEEKLMEEILKAASNRQYGDLE